MIDTGTTITAAREAAFSDLGNEIAILNMKNGTYYGLNEVGAFVWRLIQSPRTLGEICAAVIAEFEVAEEICQHDLRLLMQEMLEQKLILIEVRD
jgi:hypothetical protein